MNNYVCENATIIKQGIYQSIRCKTLNDNCCCVRYCPTKKSIEHNDMAKYCLKNPKRIEKEQEYIIMHATITTKFTTMQANEDVLRNSAIRQKIMETLGVDAETYGELALGQKEVKGGWNVLTLPSG